MIDFRKWFPALAVVALAFGAATTANAQQVAAFSCASNAGVPPIVRAEGLSELVGDMVLNCTGGTPTAAGAPVPQANLQIFVNTNVTSRLLSGSFSESLLIIDDVAPGSQTYCSAASGCGVTGVGGTTGGVNYGAAGVANVFQGQQSGSNSIVWLGVPIDPPGSNSTRTIRITNVRVNANQLGVSSTLIPTPIQMFISVTGGLSIPINNPQQTVAFIQPGMSFSVTNAKTSYLRCVSWNSAAAVDSTKAFSDPSGSTLKFTEGFASSFKVRQAGAAQNIPGALYNTESGFYNPAPTLAAGSSLNGLDRAGLADHGTRLHARFSNVPAGMSLFVTVENTAPGSGTAELVNTDATGGGAFSARSATNGTSAPVVLNGGSGMAVWEITSSSPNITETFEFAVTVAYAASGDRPSLGTATVAGSFAPLSTVTTSNATAPLPRFVGISANQNLFTVNPCTSNLLFVFVTNQAGFDSGIAISNTSVDPFGTAPQSGPCKLNYYGETAGGGAAPAAQTSAVIPAGKQLTAVLSTGGNYGIAATPGFQGYMIAQCEFQYAHGFAFISDVGANRVSEAYLALVLDSALPGGRTLFQSEVLGH
jgi:hypothetical protein